MPDEKSIQQMRERKEELFSKQKEISTQIKEFISKIRDHRIARDERTKSVQAEKKRRDELNDKIKDLISQIKDQPEITSSGPSISLKQVAKEIKGLEKKMETEALSFDKEKQMMKAIKDKKKIFNQAKESRETVHATGKIGKELSVLKKEADRIHAIIQKTAEESQQEHELLLGLSKKIDELKEEEKKIRDEILSIKSVLKDVAPSHRKDRPREQIHKKAAEKLEKQAEAVEEKIKGKKTLTTEDLLAFQSQASNKVDKE